MHVKFMVAIGFLVCSPVYASLGDDVNPLPSSASPNSNIRIRQAQVHNYIVRESSYSEVGLIREYISLEGKIFAITWKGPLMPDLNQLLGHYFRPYVAGLESIEKSRRQQGAAKVETPELVVHSKGRLRAFFGVAYLPQFLPQGVTAGDLQ